MHSRRRAVGLSIILTWVVVVLGVSIATRQIAAFALLGLLAVFALAFTRGWPVRRLRAPWTGLTIVLLVIGLSLLAIPTVPRPVAGIVLGLATIVGVVAIAGGIRDLWR